MSTKYLNKICQTDHILH